MGFKICCTALVGPTAGFLASSIKHCSLLSLRRTLGSPVLSKSPCIMKCTDSLTTPLFYKGGDTMSISVFKSAIDLNDTYAILSGIVCLNTPVIAWNKLALSKWPTIGLLGPYFNSKSSLVKASSRICHALLKSLRHISSPNKGNSGSASFAYCGPRGSGVIESAPCSSRIY